MRSSLDLLFPYAFATVFLAVGIRAFLGWRRNSAAPQAHLAIATGLFGLNQLISALNQTIYPRQDVDVATVCAYPRGLSIVSSILLFASMYAFLFFLADFLTYPAWARAGSVVVTLVCIGLAIITPVARASDPVTHRFVNCPEATAGDVRLFNINLLVVLIWLTVAFGVLTVSFLRYSGRVSGLAKVRMRSIGSGFGLILLAIMLIAVLLQQRGTGFEIFARIIQLVVLIAAPLLLIGFTPPAWLARRYPD